MLHVMERFFIRSFYLFISIQVILTIIFICYLWPEPSKDSSQLRVTLNKQSFLEFNKFYIQSYTNKYLKIAKKKAPIRYKLFLKSKKSEFSIYLNASLLYSTKLISYTRGLHVLVIHELTSKLRGSRVFDTYQDKQESSGVESYIEQLSNSSIIIAITNDDASLNLLASARSTFQRYGSRKLKNLSFRGTWIFAFRKLGEVFIEFLRNPEIQGDWPHQVSLSLSVTIKETQRDYRCKHFDTVRRKVFCETVSGYKEFCRCDYPRRVEYPAVNLPKGLDERLKNTPIIIIAGDRPEFLVKSVETLIKTSGVTRSQITIDSDAYLDEVYHLATLFNIKSIRRKFTCNRNCRIASHYFRAITDAFGANPKATEIIILEDDVLVSPDFMAYVAQLLGVLAEDKSLFCVSAWNDQGYIHTTGHRSMLTRVQTMPGLGWVLRRELFENELRQHWPALDIYFDWDVWIRQPRILKGRDCVIPDLSRSYHIGTKGVNVHPFFQKAYFANKPWSRFAFTNFEASSVKKENYEITMQLFIQVSV